MKRSTKRNLLAWAIAAALGAGYGGMTAAPAWAAAAPAAAAAADLSGLDDALAAVAKYKLGESRAPLEKVQQIVIAVQKNPAARATVAKKLADLLATDAGFEGKDFACRQLYIIGTPAEVPAVAKLLGDEKLGHMARYVLEAMAAPEADAAMRDALARVTGREKLGIIGSLGNRKDAAAVPALTQLLADQDAQVASAAAAALGKIGGDAAVKALTAAAAAPATSPEVKKTVLDALLVAGDGLAAAGKGEAAAAVYQPLLASEGAVALGALRGLAVVDPDKAMPVLMAWLKGDDAVKAGAAGGIVRQLRGDAGPRALAAEVPNLPPRSKVLVLEALAARGDSAGLDVATKLAGDASDEAVQVAAVRALGSIGNASSVPALATLAATGSGPVKEAARASLARVKGAGVDEAVAAAAASGSADVRSELIRALAARGATGAAPKLLEMAAGDAEERVRVAALNALGALVSPEQFPALVARVGAARSDGERNAAVAAVGTAAGRFPDRDAAAAVVAASLENAAPAAKPALLVALNRIAGPRALDAVRAAARSTDAAVKEAAVRTLTEWPDASALDDMLAIVKGGSQKEKILALRGINRVLSARGEQVDNRRKLAIFEQMMAASERPEEKTLVIGGLGDMRDSSAFAMLLPLLEDDALRAPAANAIVKVARQTIRNQAAPTRAALEKVVASKADDNVKKQATELLQRGR